ncbi:hypothetical protein RKD52_004339 [Metabacillus sp. SLBN-84]
MEGFFFMVKNEALCFLNLFLPEEDTFLKHPCPFCIMSVQKLEVSE